MQLTYICKKNEDGSFVDINLSSRYNVTFNENKKSICVKKLNKTNTILVLSKSNYAFVNDLVVLVGKNGSGKTTAIRMISDVLNNKENYFFIYESNRKLFYVNKLIAKKNMTEPKKTDTGSESFFSVDFVKINFSDASDITCEKSSFLYFNTKESAEYQNERYVLFSNVFDNMHIQNSSNIINLTTNSILKSAQSLKLNPNLSTLDSYTQKQQESYVYTIKSKINPIFNKLRFKLNTKHFVKPLEFIYEDEKLNFLFSRLITNSENDFVTNKSFVNEYKKLRFVDIMHKYLVEIKSEFNDDYSSI